MRAHTDTGTLRLLFLNLLAEDYKVVLNPQESLLRFHFNVGTSLVRQDGACQFEQGDGVGRGALTSASKSCSPIGEKEIESPLQVCPSFRPCHSAQLCFVAFSQFAPPLCSESCKLAEIDHLQ